MPVQLARVGVWVAVGLGASRAITAVGVALGSTGLVVAVGGTGVFVAAGGTGVSVAVGAILMRERVGQGSKTGDVGCGAPEAAKADGASNSDAMMNAMKTPASNLDRNITTTLLKQECDQLCVRELYMTLPILSISSILILANSGLMADQASCVPLDSIHWPPRCIRRQLLY